MVRIVEASTTIETDIDGVRILKNIERAARTCYKSEGLITDDSYLKIVKKLMESEHESVLEHESIMVRFVVDRGVSHESVRHRLVAVSQESTRYCSYAKDKFGNEITVIHPFFWNDEGEMYAIWLDAMEYAERAYMKLISMGASPQEARTVLPNSLKTEFVLTANLREWRHIFKMRTSPKAHPQMIEVMVPLLAAFKRQIPLVFDDIGIEEGV